MDQNGWWIEHADGDHEVASAECPWVPTLQTDGMCLSLPVAFATEQECCDWIATKIIGVGWLDPEDVRTRLNPPIGKAG